MKRYSWRQIAMKFISQVPQVTSNYERADPARSGGARERKGSRVSDNGNCGNSSRIRELILKVAPVERFFWPAAAKGFPRPVMGSEEKIRTWIQRLSDGVVRLTREVIESQGGADQK